jgi:hypothetical protein
LQDRHVAGNVDLTIKCKTRLLEQWCILLPRALPAS